MALGGLPVVVVEHSAQSLPALDRSGKIRACRAGEDQLIVEPLVITLSMIMRQKLAGHPPSRTASSQSDPPSTSSGASFHGLEDGDVSVLRGKTQHDL